jgi:hypothetical protein
MMNRSADRCRRARLLFLLAAVFGAVLPVGMAADGHGGPGSSPVAGAESTIAPAAASTPLPRPPGAVSREHSDPLPTARAALPAVGSLLVLLGAFWFALHAVARRRHAGGQGSPAALDCLGRWQIGKHPLYLVRIGSRLLVLSGAHDSLACLAEISEPAEVERLLQSCETDGEVLPPLVARFAQHRPPHWLAER